MASEPAAAPDAPSRITLPCDCAALQRLSTTFAKAADFTRKTDRVIYDALIHAMSAEQDMRKMGGIWRLVPLTYTVMWVGSLALAGLPFFAGYYSKDVIIESAFAANTGVGTYAFWLGIAAAAMNPANHRLASAPSLPPAANQPSSGSTPSGPASQVGSVCSRVEIWMP